MRGTDLVFFARPELKMLDCNTAEYFSLLAMFLSPSDFHCVVQL